MKRILYGWIELILKFETEEEFNQYLNRSIKNAEAKKQPLPVVRKIRTDPIFKSVTVRIRKAYNWNAIPKEGEIENEFCGKAEEKNG